MKYWVKGAIGGLIYGVIAELTAPWTPLRIPVLPVEMLFHNIDPNLVPECIYDHFDSPLLVATEMISFIVLGIVVSFIITKLRRSKK